MAKAATVNPEQYVLWLLGHANDGQLIITEAEAVVTAVGVSVPATAAALKTLVDTIAGEFANFPTETTPPATTAKSVAKADFAFNPGNWAAILQLILQLIGTFKGTPTPTTP